jgi:hypothetical protein
MTYPTQEHIDKTFKSLAKAWPVLVDHANHIDGEFDIALTNMRSIVKALQEAAKSSDSRSV